jgi:predicted unusual protein kinase regulating ubiquinone biosynthesis (AarF/ABC1/UbiB family)
LMHLYSKDVLHGDPHLGNIIVYYPHERSTYFPKPRRFL